nr:MAG TPA: hypothetical protein [Caudoviricetes sp.]
MARTKDMNYALAENVNCEAGDIEMQVKYKGKRLESESIRGLSELFKKT